MPPFLFPTGVISNVRTRKYLYNKEIITSIDIFIHTDEQNLTTLFP